MNNQATIARIRQALEARGIIKQGVVATQGYLRFQTNISTPLTAFNFNVLENTGTVYAGEKRLAITDMFTITHWSIYVGRCAAASAGATPTNAQLSIMKLYTNNNPLVFTTAGDNLKSLFNGSLTVTVDRDRLIDGYDMMRFYRVDAAQEGLQQTVTATTGTFPLDGWNGPNYGFAEVDPEITLNGVGQNDIIVTVPNSTDFTPAVGNFTNFAVMVARGIRWQNASKLNA
jgi:hypothetical protein